MSTIRAATQTTKLGRYRVVKRLAAGGMADVLLARTDGIEGFERHIVIKRIHADLLEEERYITMFLDEARLAASLHHHNIVQVNDIGEEDGEYFFAMEYVHGEDARHLLVEASKRGQTIPLEHVVTIVTGAAAGLHHAHEQRGPDRSPLHIVHRDVSPANILVGFDGSVKVADFGIALAAHRAEQTQSGVLKGKVAYMSPEQCNCERVDRRSDVFSLGIVLYELSTVHPCFAGDNDFMTMSAIVNGKLVPPSRYNAAVTPALEAIILKALARSPADRYQTADELRIALERYAASANLRSSTTALADYMKQQFGTRALPWLEDAPPAADDDDEPEISVLRPIPQPPPSVIVEDELAIPVEALGRPIKQTLPLRPVKMPLPLPAPEEAVTDVYGDGLAVPVVPPKPTPAPVSSALVPSAPVVEKGSVAVDEPVASPAAVPAELAADSAPEPVATESTLELGAAEAVRSVAQSAARRWWLLCSILAVIAAALALVVVATDSRDGATPARVKRTKRPHVTPLPASRLESPPSVTSDPEDVPEPAPAPTPAAEPPTPAAQVAPAPAAAVRKPSKPAAKPRPSAAPKWDPDALFPQ